LGLAKSDPNKQFLLYDFKKTQIIIKGKTIYYKQYMPTWGGGRILYMGSPAPANFKTLVNKNAIKPEIGGPPSNFS
jgi:hypothetical protein